MTDYIVRKRMIVERDWLVKNVSSIGEALEKFNSETNYLFPHEQLISETVVKVFPEDYL